MDLIAKSPPELNYRSLQMREFVGDESSLSSPFIERARFRTDIDRCQYAFSATDHRPTDPSRNGTGIDLPLSLLFNS